MTLGPLEYLVVGFEGNRFTGQILQELQTAREKGIIRVIDLFLLKKDVNGNVEGKELSDLSAKEAEQLGPLAGNIMSVFGPDDIEKVAGDIPNNCSAALLLFEHTWAIGLKEAIKNASGIPVAGGLISADVVRELEEELQAAQQGAKQEKAAAKVSE